ncbi:MAG TPA: hypothetical protein VHE30_22580 [Polyangiaceae bacterium]|nr:hypothetical protein [Polyangiaceae bacterium]
MSEASAGGLLLVDVSRPRHTIRGRLGLLIDGAVERALESRGAPPPGAAALSNQAGQLSDQIRRAGVTGSTGLAIWLPCLTDLAVNGALDAADSESLRFWLRAGEGVSVRVGLDSENLGLSVYLPPVTLASVLAAAASTDDVDSSDAGDDSRPSHTDLVSAERHDEDSESAHDEDSELAPDQDVASASGDAGAPVEADGLDDAPAAHAAAETTDDFTDGHAAPAAAPADDSLAESARAMAQTIEDGGDTGWLKDALMELSTPPPRATVEDDADDARVSALMPPVPLPPRPPRLDLRFAAEPESDEPPVVVEKTRPKLDAETLRKLEGCARELRAASGPKPLAVVERLFANAYVPIRAALDRGAEAPSLAETADEWAKSFEKSYTDAFDALRVRAKRPPMVVDVPEIALRVSRLHGARATQMLLVDGLRYDLGDAVNERLRALVGQRAACAERFLLWSALPTTTAVQLELIGRGPQGLRDLASEVNEDLVVARGRKASMIRRLKTGHREVLKLDAVEAHLAEPGGADATGFDAVADEVAQRIAAHFEGLQPRTLVMVFGDHGFQLQKDGEGPWKARSGGGSPEEVLVPAFAWLVGAVH